MIRVGIAGMGMMGRFHFRAYAKVPGARVVAVADPDRERLAGWEEVGGNLRDARGNAVDLADVRRFPDVETMAKDPGIDVIDICMPTPGHAPAAIACLRGGKHVLVEKPLARNSREGARVVRAAERADRALMAAHCLRFAPEYRFLERVVRSGRYGDALRVSLWRFGSMPGWSSRGWMEREEQSGGVPLDLQIHDLDVAQWLFGRPAALQSHGIVREGPGVVHAVTRLEYPGKGPLVTCEASWLMSSSYGFRSGFTAIFEKAVVSADSSRSPSLEVFPSGRAGPKAPVLRGPDGYVGELRHFIDSLRRGEKPTAVPNDDAVFAVKMAETVSRSIRQRRRIPLG